MIYATPRNESGVENAVAAALEQQEVVEMRGEYPIARTVKCRSKSGAAPLGLTILGGGPAWEAIEPMQYMAWGGAAFDWKGEDGVILQADGIYQRFQGVSWFGFKEHKVTGVAIPYAAGMGTGKHVYEHCGFHRLDSAIEAGDETNANCDMIWMSHCAFNQVAVCYRQLNWQGVDSSISDSVFAFVDTVFDVVRGGRCHLHNPTICYTRRLLRVQNTSYQLNTYNWSNLLVDAGKQNGDDSPTLLTNDAKQQVVRLTVNGAHWSHTPTNHALIECGEGSRSLVVLRDFHRVGKLCSGHGEATVVLDCCTVDAHAWPGCPIGLGSGVLLYKDGKHFVAKWRTLEYDERLFT